jgi:hypothetical protein
MISALHWTRPCEARACVTDGLIHDLSTRRAATDRLIHRLNHIHETLANRPRPRYDGLVYGTQSARETRSNTERGEWLGRSGSNKRRRYLYAQCARPVSRSYARCHRQTSSNYYLMLVASKRFSRDSTVSPKASRESFAQIGHFRGFRTIRTLHRLVRARTLRHLPRTLWHPPRTLRRRMNLQRWP